MTPINSQLYKSLKNIKIKISAWFVHKETFKEEERVSFILTLGKLLKKYIENS